MNLYLISKLHNSRNHHSHFISSLCNASLSHSLLNLSFLFFRPNSPGGSTRWDLTCRTLTTCLCWCPCSQTAPQRVSGLSYSWPWVPSPAPCSGSSKCGHGWREGEHSRNLEGHIDINYPLLLPVGNQVITEFWEPLLSICIRKRHKSKHPKCYCLSLNKCYQCARRLWSLLTIPI